MHEPGLLPKISLIAEAALAKGKQDAIEGALEMIVALSRYCSDVISPDDPRLIELDINQTQWKDIDSDKDQENV